MALQYDKVLDHMDGPYIISMFLAFSGIIQITLVTVDQPNLWFNLLYLDTTETKNMSFNYGHE